MQIKLYRSILFATRAIFYIYSAHAQIASTSLAAPMRFYQTRYGNAVKRWKLSYNHLQNELVFVMYTLWFMPFSFSTMKAIMFMRSSFYSNFNTGSVWRRFFRFVTLSIWMLKFLCELKIEVMSVFSCKSLLKQLKICTKIRYHRIPQINKIFESKL